MIGSRNLDLYDEVDREVPLKAGAGCSATSARFPPRDIERIARMGVVLTTHTNNYLYKGLPRSSRRGCRPSVTTRSIRCAR